MPVHEWSANVIGADLDDQSQLSEDLGDLVARLKSGTDVHVLLNCQRLQYLNSSHLTQLVALMRLVEPRKKQLILCAVPANVRSVLTVSGFGNSFRIAADITCALAELRTENAP